MAAGGSSARFGTARWRMRWRRRSEPRRRFLAGRWYPLWVRSRHCPELSRCPLYPQKRTFAPQQSALPSWADNAATARVPEAADRLRKHLSWQPEHDFGEENDQNDCDQKDHIDGKCSA